MVKPAIILADSGYHNSNLEAVRQRLSDAKAYQDLSTAILTPTRGCISPLVVSSWLYMYLPANQRNGRLFVQGIEVGDAYNAGIESILMDPRMEGFRYLLTMEDDNIPPNDGLLKLYENICDCDEPCKEHFVIVAGLYFTKGEDGLPMIWGDPSRVDPVTFEPQIPQEDAIQDCNGTGMGFTLMHLGLFRSVLDNPWFKTSQAGTRDEVSAHTQDLFFMEKLRSEGYRIAVDTRVKVGHWDSQEEMVW